MPQTVLAVDLGAGSGRVMAVGLDAQGLNLRELHRFANGPVRDGRGSLRWPWESLLAQVRKGIDAGIDAGPVASIGVDTWGVDYGLVDEDGALVADPYCYRDERTHSWRETIERLGARRVYETTGIQMMAPNTLCQLAVHDPAELSAAARLLMMPELFVHALTGEACAELTSASTTQLMDARARDWSRDLISEIGVDPAIFAPIRRPGDRVGDYRGVPIHLVGGHDTASAVAAMPAGRGVAAAYLSSGTWSLLGTELAQPELGAAAFEANFTNEAGVRGDVRFLRNVMGLWMLDECRREWGIGIDEALALGLEAVPHGVTVDAFDEAFLNPASMEDAIRAAAPGLGPGRADVVRCIFESLAAAYAVVVSQIEAVTGRRPDVLHVVGGGSRIGQLNDLTAAATGLPVVSGPVEATALGNAVVQMIALGWISGLDEARSIVARGSS